MVAKIRGLDDVLKTFRQLPISTQNKATGPALRAGANVVKKAAIDNVKSEVSTESTGILAKSIRVYSLKKIRGNLRMGVMIKKGAVNPKKTDRNGPVRVGLYGSVLEYRPGKSWLRKAARDRTTEVLNVVEKESLARIDAAVKDAQK